MDAAEYKHIILGLIFLKYISDKFGAQQEKIRHIVSVFAEFETNLRKERQMEGIAKAREKGVYKGRKPSVDVQKVKELRDNGLGASAIAKELRIGRASVYRALGTSH